MKKWEINNIITSSLTRWKNFNKFSAKTNYFLKQNRISNTKIIYALREKILKNIYSVWAYPFSVTLELG